MIEAQNALLKTLEEPPPASVVRAGDVASGCAAADGALALPAASVRPAGAGGCRGGADARATSYSEADAHAAASLSDGSIGAALEGGADGLRGRAGGRGRAAGERGRVERSAPPARRREGADWSRRGGSDRDELARRLHALSSILRDLGVLLSRADERCARQRRPAAAARAAPAVVRRRPRSSCVFSGRPGAFGARAEREPEDRRRLARVPDLASRGVRPVRTPPSRVAAIEADMSSGPQRPFVSVKFSPVGRTFSFLLPELALDAQRRLTARCAASRRPLGPAMRSIVNTAEGTGARDRHPQVPALADAEGPARRFRASRSSGARRATTSSPG